MMVHVLDRRLPSLSPAKRLFASGKQNIPRERLRQHVSRKTNENGVATGNLPGSQNTQMDLRNMCTLLIYRKNGYSYTWDHAYASIQRLPLAFVLLGILTWEKTSPLSPIRVLGPSMLPTMAVDGSEVWLVCNTWILYIWRLRSVLGGKSVLRKGDIVGFSSPEHKSHVSCKRVIGLPGDRVVSFGQYVQDPIELGRLWPEESHPHHQLSKQRQRLREEEKNATEHINAYSTEVVPSEHIWLEADCPGIGLDSRQLGPIPVSWIQGVVVARIWPLRRLAQPKHRRPQPIALDDETLRQHNLHRVQQETE